ncbi:Indoleamine 2,3-dioxygenase subfamily [Paramyrothecium foliicola]|nr:Indoleamine 2,3-dioxygenase subfamily [Paramyrothecium foliicola]
MAFINGTNSPSNDLFLEFRIAPLKILLKMGRYHDLIDNMASRFAQEAWSELGHHDSVCLSKTESDLLGPRYDDFFNVFPPWENEQHTCVYDFLERIVNKEETKTWDEKADLLDLHKIRRSPSIKFAIRHSTNKKVPTELTGIGVANASTILQDYSLDQMEALYVQYSEHLLDQDAFEVWRITHLNSPTTEFIGQSEFWRLRQRAYVLWDMSRVKHHNLLRSFEEHYHGYPPQTPDLKFGLDNSFARRTEVWVAGGYGYWSPDDYSKLKWRDPSLNKQRNPRYWRGIVSLASSDSDTDTDGTDAHETEAGPTNEVDLEFRAEIASSPPQTDRGFKLTMPPAYDLIDSCGLSKTYGFLPEHPPLGRFPEEYYGPWDDLIADLPQLIASGKLSQRIAELPLLLADRLVSEGEFQRAYVVLSYLVHALVWAGRDDGKATELIPPQITEPYLAVCERLGMQQVLSYAGLCLWNWRSRVGEDEAPEGGFYELSQLDSIGSFTKSRGEDAFNHVPVLIEAEAGSLVGELLRAVDDAAKGDIFSVTKSLCRTAEVFGKMVKHLPKLYSPLDAHMFYNQLRPYLAGGKGMEDKGLSRGFVFQRSDGSELAFQHIGGSAAQSGVFHFLDMVLGVEHKGPKDGSEWQEMRRYMPRNHRDFLDAASQLPSLRSFVQRHSSNNELCQAFDAALKQLRTWRSTHIAVVSTYVVRPARQAAAQAQCPTKDATPGATEFEAADGEELQGTAGSALIPFLKQSRDETTALVNDAPFGLIHVAVQTESILRLAADLDPHVHGFFLRPQKASAATPTTFRSLPADCVGVILEHSVEYDEDGRATNLCHLTKLRLVCRTFDNEILSLLCLRGLLWKMKSESPYIACARTGKRPRSARCMLPRKGDAAPFLARCILMQRPNEPLPWNANLFISLRQIAAKIMSDMRFQGNDALALESLTLLCRAALPRACDAVELDLTSGRYLRHDQNDLKTTATRDITISDVLCPATQALFFPSDKRLTEVSFEKHVLVARVLLGDPTINNTLRSILLSKGPKALSSRKRRTLLGGFLEAAIRSRNVDLACFLLSHDVDITSSKTRRDEAGGKPEEPTYDRYFLELAVQVGDPDIVEMFLERPFAKGVRLQPLILDAVCLGHAKVAWQLLNHCFPADERLNSEYFTVTEYGYSRQKSTAEYFYDFHEKKSAKILGWALIEACHHRDAACVSALLSCQATSKAPEFVGDWNDWNLSRIQSQWEARSRRGLKYDDLLPVMIAANNRDMDILKLLLDHGANPHAELYYLKDGQKLYPALPSEKLQARLGTEPLRVCACRGDTQMADLLFGAGFSLTPRGWLSFADLFAQKYPSLTLPEDASDTGSWESRQSMVQQFWRWLADKGFLNKESLLTEADMMLAQPLAQSIEGTYRWASEPEELKSFLLSCFVEQTSETSFDQLPNSPATIMQLKTLIVSTALGLAALVAAVPVAAPPSSSIVLPPKPSATVPVPPKPTFTIPVPPKPTWTKPAPPPKPSSSGSASPPKPTITKPAPPPRPSSTKVVPPKPTKSAAPEEEE